MTDLKVAIVGQAPRSFEYPDDHQVWVINGPRTPPRWDRLFQLHGLDHIRDVDTEGDVWELMTHDATCEGRQLVMWDDPMTRTPLMKHATPYPLREITAGLPLGFHYLTSSFALAIALAVHEGARRIMLDGVQFHGSLDHWSAGEAWAVPCIEYHLGRASARGVDVVVPEGSGLFRFGDFVYGFEGPGSV